MADQYVCIYLRLEPQGPGQGSVEAHFDSTTGYFNIYGAKGCENSDIRGDADRSLGEVRDDFDEEIAPWLHDDKRCIVYEFPSFGFTAVVIAVDELISK